VRTTETRIEQLEHRLGLAGDDGTITFRLLVTLYDADGNACLADAVTGELVELPDDACTFTLSIDGETTHGGVHHRLSL
jgi:hypothetical protein